MSKSPITVTTLCFERRFFKKHTIYKQALKVTIVNYYILSANTDFKSKTIDYERAEIYQEFSVVIHSG